MTKDQFIHFLEGILHAVRADDSMEGRIVYQWGDEPGIYNVHASVRVGNSHGQGGMMLVNDKMRDDE